MTKEISLILVLMAGAYMTNGEFQCSVVVPDIPLGWINMTDNCVKTTRNQIQSEINASFQYLAMGAYFLRDTVNRPNTAEYFIKSSWEERDHGAKLIEYLSMRGELTDDITSLIRVPEVKKQKWSSVVEALEDALALEISVTESIRKLIHICENKPYNHYHFVDYLTGVYLEEQLHGQRDLAGKLTTLKKMMGSQGALGEFHFDKNM